MPKISHERWKTYKNVFDEFTLRTIFKLTSQGHLDELASPISIGKEANVFSAVNGDKKVILKIYRLETCDFNKMYTYIRTDPRYDNLKKQRRKIIFAWCQREYRNLLKAREANVSVPTPIAFLNNVLVMEFIGDEQAASKLKDELPKNKKKFFAKVIDNMNRLYNAGMVHSDLSGFNILNNREMPVLIDFSQCIPVETPNSEEYLERDVRNVVIFFNKLGLKADEKKILERVKKKRGNTT